MYSFLFSNDPFDVLAFNTQKKKPPPRPPPPKFTIKSAETNQEKSKKPVNIYFYYLFEYKQLIWEYFF